MAKIQFQVVENTTIGRHSFYAKTKPYQRLEFDEVKQVFFPDFVSYNGKEFEVMYYDDCFISCEDLTSLSIRGKEG